MTLLFYLFVAASITQLLFWMLIFSRLALYRAPPPANSERRPVSVIICARNEAENLEKNLRHILSQNYRSFEVIVVNHHSQDRTPEILLEFQNKWPNFRIVHFDEPKPGKKAALQAGIAAARHDLILLTDADCVPASERWISQMQSALRGVKQLALGFSPYRRQPGVLNAFIRYETIYTAIQYHSFALSGIPYMGVGRNLAYDKRLFMRDHGFEAHAHVLSGDDDLFVNRVARAHNTVIVLHPDAFVFSEPQSAWRGYYYQKRRHLGAGRHYKPVHQALLGLLAASHCGHYGLGLILLCGGAMTLSVLIYYLVRIGVVSLLGGLIARKLGDPSLRPWIPLFDAAFVWYYFLFAPALIGNIKQWKQ